MKHYSPLMLILIACALCTGPAAADVLMQPVASCMTGYPVQGIAITPDGNLASAAFSEKLCLVDASGTLHGIVTVGTLHDVAISPDGERIAVASEKVRIFDRSLTEVWSWNNGYIVYSIAFIEGGEAILAGFDDRTLRRLNVNGDEDWNLTLSADPVRVAATPAGEYIIVGTKTGDLCFFNVELRELWRYRLGSQPVSALAISDDAKTIAAASQDEMLYVFNMNGRLLWDYPTGGTVRDLAVSSEGDLIAAGGDTVRIFARNGTLLWKDPSESPAAAVALSGGGDTLAAGGRDAIAFFRASPLSSAAPPAPEETATPTEPAPPEELPIPKATEASWPPVPCVLCAIGLALVFLRR
ncbi:MAG: PQQ-binding-like beta-propeller repeat protein [Methanomicrobiaceae archaeon]|nr:PQQ-binding-like beta-propeller repeat protein [Methanomicrobiaceae archaeon]